MGACGPSPSLGGIYHGWCDQGRNKSGFGVEYAVKNVTLFTSKFVDANILSDAQVVDWNGLALSGGR